jgi:hypothetical protein
MQDQDNVRSDARDFIQLAQLAFKQARANLESARVMMEKAERFLENARTAKRKAAATGKSCDSLEIRSDPKAV